MADENRKTPDGAEQFTDPTKKPIQDEQALVERNQQLDASDIQDKEVNTGLAPEKSEEHLSNKELFNLFSKNSALIGALIARSPDNSGDFDFFYKNLFKKCEGTVHQRLEMGASDEEIIQRSSNAFPLITEPLVKRYKMFNGEGNELTNGSVGLKIIYYSTIAPISTLYNNIAATSESGVYGSDIPVQPEDFQDALEYFQSIRSEVEAEDVIEKRINAIEGTRETIANVIDNYRRMERPSINHMNYEEAELMSDPIMEELMGSSNSQVRLARFIQAPQIKIPFPSGIKVENPNRFVEAQASREIRDGMIWLSLTLSDSELITESKQLMSKYYSFVEKVLRSSGLSRKDIYENRFCKTQSDKEFMDNFIDKYYEEEWALRDEAITIAEEVSDFMLKCIEFYKKLI